MNEERKKKGALAKKILLWTAIVLMLVIGVGCFYISNFVTQTLDSIERPEVVLDHEDLDTQEGLSEEVINIAVFGVDSRTTDVAGRSDAMMIVSLDMKHNKIKAVSVMRDSLVNISGYGKAKINSAYARGGVALAIKTLNQNFKMNITDYVALNFNQLAGIVDALGGVEVELSEAERNNANKYIKEMSQSAGVKTDYIKNSGNVVLHGYQAVAYTRIRYVGHADFERTERQREVMQKLMNKALNTNPVKYPSLIKSLIPMVETSLSNEEILSIASGMLMGGTPEFEQGRFPIDGTYNTNSNYAMVYDLEAAANKLHRFIYDDEPFYEEKE